MLGGAPFKEKNSFYCIVLLGITIGAGLSNLEIQHKSLSNFFNNLFKNKSTQSRAPQRLQSIDPIGPIVSTGTYIKNTLLPEISKFISTGYEWIKQEENSKLILKFVKNFWNFEFLKQILFNLPWTVYAWINVLKEKEMLVKFPTALKRAKTLSLMFAGLQERAQGPKDQSSLNMVNWLYVRLFINPRKTLNILSRSSISKNLICNGSPSRGSGGKQQKWLGNCFFEKNGPPKNRGKLKDEVKTFLETGENLKDKERKKSK